MWVSRGALVALLLSGCVNLAPKYKPPKFVVPESYKGVAPFVEAKPSDAALRADWWKLFDDPVLDALESQAMNANADLQASAERFVQARDQMMMARSRYLPQLGAEAHVSGGRRSPHATFVSNAVPLYDYGVGIGLQASWEPDFWSARRNGAKVETYRAEERAADFANARLSIQAELAADYFELRGYDAQDAIYRQSIKYYEDSLAMVTTEFKGAIASGLDVARSQYQLSTTQAAQIAIRAKRQVAEHAIAVLCNRAASSFVIAPVDLLAGGSFTIPRALPSTLLQRRPDIAAAERQMAEANREIGIARAAFYPNVTLGGEIGFESPVQYLFQLASAAWSLGAQVVQPIFQGGYNRAQLQQSWSQYRETEDTYRSTVLDAFREVEDGMSRTDLIATELERQSDAVDAATKQQDMSMALFKGGLASSLDLITSQVNTLESRLRFVELQASLLRAKVGLIRALGGGWDQSQLPTDDQIQPMKTFQYTHRDKPKPAGGIDVETKHREQYEDLTKPVAQ